MKHATSLEAKQQNNGNSIGNFVNGDAGWFYDFLNVVLFYFCYPNVSLPTLQYDAISFHSYLITNPESRNVIVLNICS
jgi:hypothetical protein